MESQWWAETVYNLTENPFFKKKKEIYKLPITSIITLILYHSINWYKNLVGLNGINTVVALKGRIKR